MTVEETGLGYEVLVNRVFMGGAMSRDENNEELDIVIQCQRMVLVAGILLIATSCSFKAQQQTSSSTSTFSQVDYQSGGIPEGVCSEVLSRIYENNTLRRAILIDDLIRLAECDPEQANRAATELNATRTVESLQRCQANKMLTPEQLNILQYYCEENEGCDIAFMKGMSPVPCPTTKAAPGGSYRFFIHSKGHYEITTAAALNAGFSKQATALLAEASQDPDFYEFKHPFAHAQTKNHAKYGFLIEPDSEAMDAFMKWVSDIIKKVDLACMKYQIETAGYWLGYGFHGIRDLVLHEGNSNAEHSYLDNIMAIGVDDKWQYVSRFDVATQGSIIFLDEVLKWQ